MLLWFTQSYSKARSASFFARNGEVIVGTCGELTNLLAVVMSDPAVSIDLLLRSELYAQNRNVLVLYG